MTPSGGLTFAIGGDGEGESRVQFEAIRQHDDGLGVPLAFVHREPNRRRTLGKLFPAHAPRVFDHPPSAPILPDEQAGADGGRPFDTLIS